MNSDKLLIMNDSFIKELRKLITLGLFSLLLSPAFAPPNDLRVDSNFISAAETADGFVYVLKQRIGTTENPRLILTRYTPNGQLDQSFGEHGGHAVILPDLGKKYTLTNVFLALAPTGKLLVSGNYKQSGESLPQILKNEAMRNLEEGNFDEFLDFHDQQTRRRDFMGRNILFSARLMPDGSEDISYGKKGKGVILYNFSSHVGDGVEAVHVDNNENTTLVVERTGRTVDEEAATGDLVVLKIDKNGKRVGPSTRISTKSLFPDAVIVDPSGVSVDQNGGVLIYGNELRHGPGEDEVIAKPFVLDLRGAKQRKIAVPFEVSGGNEGGFPSLATHLQIQPDGTGHLFIATETSRKKSVIQKFEFQPEGQGKQDTKFGLQIAGSTNETLKFHDNPLGSVIASSNLLLIGTPSNDDRSLTLIQLESESGQEVAKKVFKSMFSTSKGTCEDILSKWGKKSFP
jgi:hypothetical protein